MSYQVRVGIPLVKSLEVAAQDCKDPAFKTVLAGLQSQIESGKHKQAERESSGDEHL